MCGVAGRYHPTRLPPDPSWRAEADARLAHRGPDGSGSFADDRCELVHRRLALIDLSPTGAQPMANEDGSVLVTYNGEIYNHRELRDALLRRGHAFRGTSDTEVLVHLYEEHGEAIGEHLRGIYAFAIYDRARNRIVLVRDRFGIKPLFVAEMDGQWAFASEIKAITALRGFRPRLDRQACYDFLGLGYVPEPATGFANVTCLTKGTTLTIDAGGARSRPFYSPLAAPVRSLALGAATDAAAAALVDAVERQSVADVPVAALLSGGIDSSLVVAARGRAAADTTTFNVRFPDRAHDETASALAVARRYGTTHHTIDLESGALTADALLELVRHFDQPFADTSFVPMFSVAKAVRDRGIVCTLSGDGGDEAFGGYARFWRAERLVRLMRLPAWTRRAAQSTASRLAPYTRDLGRQVSKAVQLASAGSSDSSVLLAGLSSYLSEEQKRELVRPEAREPLVPAYRHFDGHDPAGTADLEELSRRMTENLFAVGLPGDMLRKVDMMSMRASIEVRVPLLDEELVALGLALPHALKTDGASGKRVLRALAERWLPADVAAAPKHGFTVPLDVMVPESFHAILRELLLAEDARTREFLAPGLVEAWLAAFARARHGARLGTISRAGLYQRVFMLLALELWMRDHALRW